ncbi:uncharacterized protein VNE69_02154 [Vairimorpha necatrix]|uniref:Uncharacterized protein n=1 Tax=Vairimorpha necatrix TaxID=6039 RepID=A0AAX4J9I8_9MICR
MLLFITVLKCSFNNNKTIENNTRLLFKIGKEENINNLKITGSKHDFMTILAEGNNEMAPDVYYDPNTEILFEYLINGGDFEQYKRSYYANNPSLCENIKITKKLKKNSHKTLKDQLNDMKDKFDSIKKECRIHFGKRPDYQTKIKFNKEETKNIIFYRSYIGKFFLYFTNKIIYYTKNIEDDILKLNFPDNEQAILVLEFVRDVFNFIKPKNNNLHLNDDSLHLLYNFSKVNWKIRKITDVFRMPLLLALTHEYCERRMPNKCYIRNSILNDLIKLKNKWIHIYSKKEKLSSYCAHICQIIAKGNDREINYINETYL